MKRKSFLLSMVAMVLVGTMVVPLGVHATEVSTPDEPQVVQEQVTEPEVDTETPDVDVTPEVEATPEVTPEVSPEVLVTPEVTVTPVVTEGVLPEEILEDEEIVEVLEEEMSLDELVTGFIYQEAGAISEDDGYAKKGTLARSKLSAYDQMAYDQVKAYVEGIARGYYSSAVIPIDVSKIVGRGSTRSVSSYFDIQKIVNALRYDCPYDMYWFGLGYSWNTLIGYSTYSGGNYNFTTFNLTISVSRDYTNFTGSFSGGKYYSGVDTAKTAATYAAVSTALSIVSTAVGMDDYDIMRYYMYVICAWTDYNHPAVENSSTPYGNPWQLIWVFDGDPSTKVVCEGYSKAFKLLCDLTQFSGPIECRIAEGDVYFYSGGGGAHMWNVVKMDDGKNYLVDVTNCDGSVVDEWLFMAPAISNNTSVSSGFKVGNSRKYATFYYDSNCINGYNASDLMLSTTPYTKPVPKNGLVLGTDNVWRLYENNVWRSDYNDLYCDANVGWWKITNGVIDFGYTDLYCSPTVGWWKIVGGTIDFGYSDLYCSPTLGWWKVNGGQLDYAYTDLYCSPTLGWWKVNGGQLDFTYTDLYCSPTLGWWKVNGGQLDYMYTDLYCSPTLGWWKVNGGQLDYTYTDLYCSPTLGWWKVNGGQLDYTYTDLYCSPNYGWWKVNGGQLDYTYTDLYGSPTLGWWKVNGGQLDYTYTGVYFSPTYGWWKIVGGKVVV